MPLKPAAQRVDDLLAAQGMGGRVVEFTETEHMIRGRGYIRNVQDLEKIVLKATDDGTPVLLSDVAEVQIGPDIKRGIAEKNGTGERRRL